MGRGLSPMQSAILDALRSFPTEPPQGVRFQATDLAATGDVIDAIGRLRTPESFASVSRALNSLAKRGLVRCYSAHGYLRGKGWRYCLPRS